MYDADNWPDDSGDADNALPLKSPKTKLHERTPNRARATPLPVKPQPWHDVFFEAYAELGTVKEACSVANIQRSTFYTAMSGDPAFADRYEQSKQDYADNLRKELRVRQKTSDRLFELALKGACPEFRETAQTNVNISANNEIIVDLVESSLADARPALPVMIVDALPDTADIPALDTKNPSNT